MRKFLVGSLSAAVLVAGLGYSRPAEAALFIKIQSGANERSCNNATDVGSVNGVATTCVGAGFTSIGGLSSNGIAFGGFSVDGWDFEGTSSLNANVGLASSVSQAFTIDSKASVFHNTGATDVTIDTVAFNFTQPAGGGLLSGSQSVNWNTAASGDSQAFQVWARNDNATTVPGGDATTTSPLCTTGGGTTVSCSTASPDVLFTRNTAQFSLTGREIIHTALGTRGTYSGTALVTAVPEPGSMLLLGTGLLGLARRARKGRKQDQAV